MRFMIKIILVSFIVLKKDQLFSVKTNFAKLL